MLRSSVLGDAILGDLVLGEALVDGGSHNYAGSGGVETGGAAETSATYVGVFNYDGSGGVETGGEATTDTQPTHDYEGSGGVETGGTGGTEYTVPDNNLWTFGRGVTEIFQADLTQTQIRTAGRGLYMIVLLGGTTYRACLGQASASGNSKYVVSIG
ncbi:MAG: hypothetical protein ABFD89_00780 [Bryobacteraceae bacterium]